MSWRGGAHGDGDVDSDVAVEVRSDQETDDLMEDAFPSSSQASQDVSRGRIFAVIPDGAIEADPEFFASFMEQVFETGDDLQELLETLGAGHHDARPAGRSLEVIVPPSMLSEEGGSTVAFLDRVFEAFEEIDAVLNDMQAPLRVSPDIRMDVSSIVVPDEAVGDPVALLKVVDRVQEEAEKLNLIFRQAKHDLKRLSRFRISRKSPGAIVGDMRSEGELVTLQYLVGFLHSVYLAADSFEALEIPRPHIREYLEFLYRMEDWEEMGQLVRRLERAVRRYSRLRGGDE